MKKPIRALCAILSIVLLSAAFGCTQSGTNTYVDINHIINPASGMPYSIFYDEQANRYQNTTDHIISATVLSPSSMEGDCYSTAICIMGVEKATEFVEQKIGEGKITSAILFTADKKMLVFGDVVLYRKNGELDGYKKFQLIHGLLGEDIQNPIVDYPEGSYTRYTEYAFSDDFEFLLYLFGDEIEVKELIKNRMMEEIERLDEQINLTNPNSDLSLLNKASAGERIRIGKYCYELLMQSKRIYEETLGAFNVAISPLCRLWNIDIEGYSKYRSVGNERNWTAPSELPTLEQINVLLQNIDLDGLQLLDEGGAYYAVKSKSDMEIDLGGIAKGFAADICVEILNDYEIISAQLSIAGNVYEYGNYFDPSKEEASTWKIGITNPSQKHDIIKDYVLAIQLDHGSSVVTSGEYERFYSFPYKS